MLSLRISRPTAAKRQLVQVNKAVQLHRLSSYRVPGNIADLGTIWTGVVCRADVDEPAAALQVEEESKTAQAPIDWLATMTCFLFPAIGGMLFGYDIGATSGALLSLTSPGLSGVAWYQLSSVQQGLVVSLSLFGALSGSVGALLFGNKLGRKNELLLAALLYGCAAILTGTAGTLGVLLAGRAVYGVGIGLAMHAAPAYIAETAPPQARGLLISLKEGFIVAGILLGYLVSFLLVESQGGWRYIWGVSAALATVLGVGMSTLPKSPRWMMLNGFPLPDVRRAIERCRGKMASNAVVDRELQGIVEASEAAKGQDQGLFAVFSKKNLAPLSIGLALMIFQQITGQPSVLYYAGKIFQQAGFAGESAATGVSVVLGFFKLIMTGIAVLYVDKWGRRPLLLLGVSGMVAALAALAFTTLSAAGTTGTMAYLSVIALLLYVGCYQVSFGPISWLLCGELFPLSVRNSAIAIATFANFASNFLVSLVLPSLQESLGLGQLYIVFGAIGALALAYIYKSVPETKGKSLEEIEQFWKEGSSIEKSS